LTAAGLRRNIEPEARPSRDCLCERRPKNRQKVDEIVSAVPPFRAPTLYRIADLVLDEGRRELTRDGRRIELGRLTYALLAALVRNAPTVLAHDQLVEQVWAGRATSPETVTQRVKLLRDALDDDAERPRYIGLVRGQGYRLIPPVEAVTAAGTESGPSLNTGRQSFSTVRGSMRTLASEGVRWRRARTVGLALLAMILTAAGFAFVRDYLPNVDEGAPKLAVLPCENLSSRPDDTYFASGLHAEIVYRLGKLRGLRVVSRTAVLRFADTATRPSLSAIARELGARYLMECSVRYADNRILVATQLVDPGTSVPVFSQNYLADPNDLGTVFATQADLALRIARELKAGYSPAERARVERIPTDSRDAYALYLRSLELKNPPAINLLKEAIRYDENFALAHAALALRYAFGFVNSANGQAQPADRRADLEALVRDHAQRAIALDHDVPDAYTALGLSAFVSWRWKEAETDLANAVELAPTTAVLAWKIYEQLLSGLGRHKEAVALAKRALDLNPGDSAAMGQYGFQLGYAREYSAASAVFEDIIDAEPTDPLYRHWLAFMRIALRNPDAAIRLLETAEQLAADDRSVAFLVPWAYAYSRAGRRDDAMRLFDEIEHAASEGAAPGAGGWALAHLAIGDRIGALKSLETVARKAADHEPDEGFVSLFALKMNVTNDPVLRQAEFVDVLNRIRGD